MGLMPKRICITPLLPPPSTCVAGLLGTSHAAVHAQLQAHLGTAIANVYMQLRLAHDCSSTKSSPASSVARSMFCAPESEACLKMLLRWQGTYDAARVDAALESVGF